MSKPQIYSLYTEDNPGIIVRVTNPVSIHKQVLRKGKYLIRLLGQSLKYEIKDITNNVNLNHGYIDSVSPLLVDVKFTVDIVPAVMDIMISKKRLIKDTPAHIFSIEVNPPDIIEERKESMFNSNNAFSEEEIKKMEDVFKNQVLVNKNFPKHVAFYCENLLFMFKDCLDDDTIKKFKELQAEAEKLIVIDLLPCPFCGSEKVSLSKNSGLIAVCCETCHVLSARYVNEKTARTCWNKRADMGWILTKDQVPEDDTKNYWCYAKYMHIDSTSYDRVQCQGYYYAESGKWDLCLSYNIEEIEVMAWRELPKVPKVL